MSMRPACLLVCEVDGVSRLGGMRLMLPGTGSEPDDISVQGQAALLLSHSTEQLSNYLPLWRPSCILALHIKQLGPE